MDGSTRAWQQALLIDVDSIFTGGGVDPSQVDACELVASCLAATKLPLVYVSSGPFERVVKSIEKSELAKADVIVSDDGRMIHEWSADGNAWQSLRPTIKAPSDGEMAPDATRAVAVRRTLAHFKWLPENVLYFGGSNGDAPLLTSGVRAIVSASLDRAIARGVWLAHHQAGWPDRVYFCKGPGAIGLLEGLRWFELSSSGELPRPARLGATPLSFRTTFFRVWAPRRKSVRVHWQVDGRSRSATLQKHANGYHTGTIASLGANGQYQLEPEGRAARPDPVSRFQPGSVHGASQVISADGYPWATDDWKGVAKEDLVIYELHVGTFSDEGTYLAAIKRIPELIDLGVTAIELLPVAETPGEWNWGYDGVHLFACRNSYGVPEEFKLFVDACHAAGLAVILDVVYNHLGPEGNYLNEFAPYFSRKHRTPWGDAFAYDGRNAKDVRKFVLENVRYWLEEFHLDGLRLDAVHFMFDDSSVTILDEIRAEVTRLQHDTARQLHLIAEANIYDDLLVRGRVTDTESESESGSESADGGRGKTPYDAIWCDDLMHSIHTQSVGDLALTHREYRGGVDLAEVLEHGFLYRGPDVTRMTDDTRRQMFASGDRSYLSSFIVALQTHDAVGNHPHGKRLHQLTSVAFQRAAAALVMLHPSIPMLFMGEEESTESPFPFFVDFEDPQLRKRVDQGRANEYPQHQWDGAVSPSDPAAFERAKLGENRERDVVTRDWYRALLRIRKTWIAADVLQPQRYRAESCIETSVFALHYEFDGKRYSVIARLAPTAEAAVIERPAAGRLVLDSLQPIATQATLSSAKSETSRGDGRIRLAARQAVVMLSD